MEVEVEEEEPLFVLELTVEQSAAAKHFHLVFHMEMVSLKFNFNILCIS
jgi:hypothetical protein